MSIDPPGADWVLFDIGGVLEIVDDDTWPAALRSRWAAELGLTVDELRSRLADPSLPDPGARAGVAEAYWSGVGRVLGVSGQRLAALRSQFWDAYCGTANTDLIAFARSLRGRARVAILSNSGDGAREEEERRYGFAAVFNPICYSHELGVAKPDPGAYTAALEQMGARAEQVLFIDDHDTGVEGALAVGIASFLHVSNADTIARVEAWLTRERTHPADE